MMKNQAFRTLFLCCLLLATLFSACGADKTEDRALPASVDASEYGTLRWPNNELSRLLPEPESTRGEIVWNDETGLGVYVADTNTEAFKQYAERCWQKGFSVNYHLDDDGFEAKNVYGYTLFINREENDVMLIRLEMPQELPPASSAAAGSAPAEDASETERAIAADDAADEKPSSPAPAKNNNRKYNNKKKRR